MQATELNRLTSPFGAGKPWGAENLEESGVFLTYKGPLEGIMAAYPFPLP